MQVKQAKFDTPLLTVPCHDQLNARVSPQNQNHRTEADTHSGLQAPFADPLTFPRNCLARH